MKLNLSALALGFALLAAFGCEGKRKKAEIRKSLSKDRALNEKDKEIATLVKGAKECLLLAKIVRNWADRHKDSFAVYLVNLDLGILVDTTFTPAENAIRSKVLLQEKIPNLVESQTGDNLLLSPTVGTLLNVEVQSECKSVTFKSLKDSNSKETPAYTMAVNLELNQPTTGPKVTSQLVLIGKEETRTYRYDTDNTFLHITVEKAHVTGQPMVQRQEYLVTPQINAPVKVRRTFLKFLEDALVALPTSLVSQMKKPVEPNAKPNPHKSDKEWLNVTRSTYLEIGNMIRQGQFKSN